MRLHTYLTYVTLGFLFLMMLTSPAILDTSSSSIGIQEEQHMVLSQLTSHAPISITANSGFGALGFPGNGSESDPYLIEDLEIEGSSSTDCIFIGGTVTAYFEIRGCRLYNSNPGVGIDLMAGHGLIESCEIYNCSRGVWIESNDHRIDSSEIHNSTIAIDAFQVDDVAVSGSTFYEAGEIIFDEVSGLTIIGNTFSDSEVAIMNCVGLTVNGNTFHIEETRELLGIYYCQVGTINNNIFNINALSGIRIQGSENIIISGCEFIASGPSGIGNLGVDMRGFEGMSDITIQDCIFQSVNCDGAFVEEGLLITNCVFTNGSIGLIDSPSAEVSSNTLTYGHIQVAYNCNDSIVYNNTLIDCIEYGIYIRENNTDLLVSTNTMKGSKSLNHHGIDLQSDGVTLYNNVIENFDSGIYIECNEGTIYNNTVFGNNLGIEIAAGSSSHNLYYNILHSNTQNANDDGANNIWDDGVSLGNYWSNIASPGEYTIPGSAGSVDRYAQPYSTGLEIPTVFLLIGVIGAVAVVAVAVMKRRR